MISKTKREPLSPGDYTAPIKDWTNDFPPKPIIDLEKAKRVVNEDEIGYQQAEFVADLPKFGDQLLDEVIKDPTINIYLDHSPKLNEQLDYEEMVKRLHYQRAAFITAEQKKKEPKTEEDLNG